MEEVKITDDDSSQVVEMYLILVPVTRCFAPDTIGNLSKVFSMP